MNGMGIDVGGLTLATPFALLLAIPLVLLLTARAQSPRAAAVTADLGPLAEAARPTWRTRLRHVPDVLRGLAILLLVVAVARPRVGLAVTALPEEGIDVVAVVDVSSSMQQRVSSSETRLQASQRVLDEFASTLQGDRLGLVMFQSRAITLSPLTHDIRAIRDRIDQLTPGLMPDGTAIGLGLTEGITLLRDSPARSRVLVLLTDGQNNVGEVSPFEAARVAEVFEIRIYAIGLSSPFGERLDTAGLTELARLTGGTYFDASTAEELQAAYQEIGDLERSRVGERRFVAFREYGPWFALAAALLLSLDMALRSTALRRQP